ncbi:MAG: polysaccharide deacetylase family protein [Christensenellales bacterium]
MKKFILILISLIAICFPIVSNGVFAEELPISDFNFYKFEGNIEHFFTHQIINRPEIAFNSQNKYRYNFYRDCVTYTEFERFLEEMYSNNYVLVDIYDCYKSIDGKVYKKDLYLPKGKKPFLLSFDDMSFDTRNKGMSDKLILDNNGEVASYTKNNEIQIEYNKEAIPILENFIKNHKDFSFNNARGIICPTGYNGILGYRINSDNPNSKSEIEKIRPLVAKLKELNYRFASHTFNHIQVACVSSEELKKDTDKYTKEILSVIGETNIYSFPCGKYTLNEYKLNILKNAGYNIFLCVGLDKQEMWEQDCLFLKRHVLDGGSMLKYRKQLLPIIDTTKIYDYTQRV